MRIELHVLQNFAPSNLNRDDTGSPKDAEFGGHRRARISSQCFKRAVRQYFKNRGLVPAEHRAERTKRLAAAVADRLRARGRDEAPARVAAEAGVAAVLAKSKVEKDEHKTPYLMFLGTQEIARFADLIDSHWDVFSAPPAAPAPAAEPAEAKPKARGPRTKPKSPDGPKAPDGFDKAVARLLDGGKAADLALFGRMLADLPDNNVDAACQVAHAISTNTIHRVEMDYYTAVDDLKPDDTAGADMIGTVEFNSACYYRYANLDVPQLVTNLQGDRDLAKSTAKAFLDAFVHAVPTGKQNSFAAHNPPSLVFAVVRDGQPLNLMNAFVKPVAAPRGEEDLVLNSIRALDRYYGRVTRVYADDGLKAGAVCAVDELAFEHLTPMAVPSLKDLVTTVIGAAFPGGAA